MRALALAVLLTAAAPAAAGAQVFFASRPHPDFAVGPLFVVANVRPELGPVTVNLSFSLTAPRGLRAADTRQDLFLLWPAEVSESTAPGGADADVLGELESHGFVVIASGRLLLRGRDRLQLGTPSLGEPLGPTASYANFVRRGQTAGQVPAGAFVKIPWTSKLAEPVSIVTLALPLRGLVTPKPATWVGELFWGRRYVLTVAFGDLGSVVLPLYPFYFEHRDRVVRLAREYSQVIANFADADHLTIEEIAPAAASRRAGRVRTGSEVVALNLAPSEGLTPQTLKVHFSYFRGLVNWRPIIVSGALLLVGNFAGVLIFARESLRTLRKRRRVRARRATRLEGANAPEVPD